MRLIRSETRKLLSTRIWWVLLIVLAAYVAFIAAVFALIFGAFSDAGEGGQLPPGADVHLFVYSAATSIGYVFPVLLGTLAVTGEFRHQTLTPSFLTVPRRGRVLGAKVTVLAIAGAIFGIVGFAAAITVGGPLLALGGVDLGLGDMETWLMVARGILAMAIWSILGVGLGALVPNQVAAIVIVIAFTQFLEPTLRAGAMLLDWAAQIGKFLPGAASDALVGASFFTGALSAETGGVQAAVLEWWQGGLVLAGIAALLVVLGSLTRWKSDVT